MPQIGFDPSTVEPSAPMGVIPAGKHPVQIEGADVKPTKAGDGEYAEIVFVVLDGVAKNRKHWERYNISNPSGEAERIARENFAALCIAANSPRIKDTDELVGRTLVIDLGITKRKDTGEEQNRIRGYYPSGTQTAAEPTPAKAPAAAGAAPPWAAGKKATA